MKVESYQLDSSKNCYDLIGLLDTLQLDGTTFGSIMINFNQNKAFVLSFKASISERKILLEQKRLNNILEKFGITYDELISKIITEIGLEMDGDATNLKLFIHVLSETKQKLLKKHREGEKII